MTFTCQDARPLISSYADGELSEAQASLLRKHLLECSRCRLAIQDEKALKRWFAHTAAPAVPRDFAARIVRRAFAGDTGVGAFEAEPLTSTAHAGLEVRGGKLHDFVLQLTAVAAAATIVFVLAIAKSERPEGRMRADEEAPSIEVLRERLEALDADNEAAALPAVEPGRARPEGRGGE